MNIEYKEMTLKEFDKIPRVACPEEHTVMPYKYLGHQGHYIYVDKNGMKLITVDGESHFDEESRKAYLRWRGHRKMTSVEDRKLSKRQKSQRKQNKRRRKKRGKRR